MPQVMCSRRQLIDKTFLLLPIPVFSHHLPQKILPENQMHSVLLFVFNDSFAALSVNCVLCENYQLFPSVLGVLLSPAFVVLSVYLFQRSQSPYQTPSHLDLAV